MGKEGFKYEIKEVFINGISMGTPTSVEMSYNPDDDVDKKIMFDHNREFLFSLKCGASINVILKDIMNSYDEIEKIDKYIKIANRTKSTRIRNKNIKKAHKLLKELQ